jgi:hypothetical protein
VREPGFDGSLSILATTGISRGRTLVSRNKSNRKIPNTTLSARKLDLVQGDRIIPCAKYAALRALRPLRMRACDAERASALALREAVTVSGKVEWNRPRILS